MGFEQKVNQTADDRRRALTSIIFASDIAGQDAVQATGAGITPNGVSAFRQTVYSNQTIVGYYNLVITRDGDNQVGWYVYWDAEAGTTGATITAILRGTFTPGDAAAGGTALTVSDEQAITSNLTLSENTFVATGVTIPEGQTFIQVFIRLGSLEQFFFMFAKEFYDLTASLAGGSISSYPDDNRAANTVSAAVKILRWGSADRFYFGRTASNQILIAVTGISTVSLEGFRVRTA